jgi:pyruvyltransferase
MHKKDILRACWLTSPAPGNFGDILTPFILAHYGYNVKHVHWNNINQADVICVGSIARIAVSGTAVLGSGIMNQKEKLCADAKWYWVRGPLTRSAVIENGGTCPDIYGDPGLLLPKIWPNKNTVKHKIGIVPHHVDYGQVKQQFPDAYVIDLVNADPQQVTDQITSCEKIISSSLHGIIAAHAYEIPAAWVKFSNKIKGDDSKFHDHYLSLGIEAQLSTVENPIFQQAKYNNDLINDILQYQMFV